MQRSTAGPAFLLFLVLVISACGGGGGTTATDAGGGGGTTTDAPSATDAPAATDATTPTEAPAATDAGSGGGATGDVCGLVTVAEMEGLFGVSGVTQQLFAGPPDTCDYQLDSAPFVAMVLSGAEFGAEAVFDAMAADPASESIGGIGDRALYNAQMLSFLVQKGDALLTIQVLDESRSEEERLELMKQIGATAAGRM